MVKSYSTVYWYVLAISLSCTFFLFVISNHIPYAHFDLDSFGYYRIATHFSQHGTLQDPALGSVIPIQTVGYPFFIGLIYRFFGEWIGWIVIVQMSMLLCIAFITRAIARLLFNEQVALLAFIITILNAGFLIFVQLVMTDILLALLLLTAHYYLLRFFYFDNKSDLYASGLLLGVSITVKPVALFYPCIIFCLLLGNYAYTKMIPLFTKFCFFFLLPLLLYVSYNTYMFNECIIAPVMKENIYIYFLAKVHAHIKHISKQEALNEIQALQQQKWENSSQLFYEYVYTYPCTVMMLWIYECAKTAVSPYLNQYKLFFYPHYKNTHTSMVPNFNESLFDALKRYFGFNYAPVMTIIFFIFLFLSTLVLHFFVISGLYFLLVNRQYHALFFFVATISYFLLITGHDGCARYRLMIEGLYMVLAAHGIVTWYELCNKKNYALLFQKGAAHAS